MTDGYAGKIELDIRDSVPDWAPYLPPKAPEGAPNVLFIAWDDLGYGTMDVFGGPVETPNMRRIADMGVRFSNFHTTALCSPTRSSLLTGRNATSNGMATIAEFSAGLPRHLDPDPVRERVHLRGAASSAGTTPTASGSGTSRRARSATSPRTRVAGRSGAASSASTASSAASRTSGIPDLVQDNSQIEPPGDARRRATTSRRTSPTRRSA